MNTPPTVEGALNFRDAGGLPCGDGRRVARGRIFRSDTLQFLTATDVHRLVAELGLRTDIDLRLPYEVEVEGRGLLDEEPAIAYHHLPLVVAGSVRDGSATPILQRHDPVVSHYLGYLESSAAALVEIVRILSRPDGSPTVIHCAAGKDRTGVAVAVVLAALGCDEQDIALEYASGSHLVPAVLDRLRSMDTYGASLDAMPSEANLTPPEYLHRFFEKVRETYGGVVAYLSLHGITDEELAGLRENLTEPVS